MLREDIKLQGTVSVQHKNITEFILYINLYFCQIIYLFINHSLKISIGFYLLLIFAYVPPYHTHELIRNQVPPDEDKGPTQMNVTEK